MAATVFKDLCARMLVPESERVAQIWQLLCSEQQARLVLAMPGTATELAERTELTPEQVQRDAQDLYYKGVAFFSDKPTGRIYRAPKHLIQLHDSSVQWAEAPPEFYDLWKAFMTEEYPSLLAMMLATGLPSFMRTIPAPGALEGVSDVQASDDIQQLIASVKEFAVCKCPCRTCERNCDNALETCMQFDKGAHYAIERGNGKRIDREQAMRIIHQAQEVGLVHLVENKRELGTVLCNCCSCCCAIIKPFVNAPDCRGVLAPSRF